MTTPLTDPVQYAFADGIATIALDDGKANAMNADWFAAFGEALDRAEKDGAAVVLLRGRTRMLSGGLDLKFLPTLAGDALPAFVRRFAETGLRLWTLPAVTVAEITGHAIAGGCVLASACDRRVGLAGDFRYQMNEHAIGIDLPEWMHEIVSSAWPRPDAERLMLLAEVYSPERAHRVGMLERLEGDAASLSKTALELAHASRGVVQRNVAVYKRRFRGPRAEAALERLAQA